MRSINNQNTKQTSSRLKRTRFYFQDERRQKCDKQAHLKVNIEMRSSLKIIVIVSCNYYSLNIIIISARTTHKHWRWKKMIQMSKSRSFMLFHTTQSLKLTNCYEKLKKKNQLNKDGISHNLTDWKKICCRYLCMSTSAAELPTKKSSKDIFFSRIYFFPLLQP